MADALGLSSLRHRLNLAVLPTRKRERQAAKLVTRPSERCVVSQKTQNSELNPKRLSCAGDSLHFSPFTTNPGPADAARAHTPVRQLPAASRYVAKQMPCCFSKWLKWLPCSAARESRPVKTRARFSLGLGAYYPGKTGEVEVKCILYLALIVLTTQGDAAIASQLCE